MATSKETTLFDALMDGLIADLGNEERRTPALVREARELCKQLEIGVMPLVGGRPEEVAELASKAPFGMKING